MPHIRFSVLGIFPSPASAATGDLRGRPFGGHALAAAVPRRGLLRRQRRRRRRRHQQLDRVPHRAAVPLPGRARRLRAIHLRPGRHKVSRRRRGGQVSLVLRIPQFCTYIYLSTSVFAQYINIDFVIDALSPTL